MKRSYQRPPPRLEWPSLQVPQTTKQPNDSSDRKEYSWTKPSTRRRRRSQPSKEEDENDGSFDLFVEKYGPKTSKELCVQPRKVKEVREWMEASLRGDTGKFLILVGNPGVGKSTMCRVLASEMNLTVLQWDDEGVAGAGPGTFTPSYLVSFEEFLHNSGAGFHHLDIEGVKRDRGCLILIEETPNLHTAQARDKFRSILTQHAVQTKHPTVFIYSDVSEGKACPGDLERLVRADILYSSSPNYAKIIQCAAVSRKMMKKCLEEIIKSEGGRRRRRPSPEVLEQIYLDSHGDIRNAVMNLQFHLSGRRNLLRNSSAAPSSGMYERDAKLSAFHALGKLLYAKRNPVKSDNALGKLLNGLDERPPLNFDPEVVMTENEMGLESAHAFLAFHSPHFFTDVTELSDAYDGFSDAALFCDKLMDPQRDRGDAIYPSEYLCSLSSRAVADANKHPAPNKFRSFCAPKIFDVMRKKKGNDGKLHQLRKRLSMGNALPFGGDVGSNGVFVMDFLPYMHSILPSEIQFAVENLYSYAKKDEPEEEVESLIHLELQQQRKILENDDIVDDDDSII